MWTGPRDLEQASVIVQGVLQNFHIKSDTKEEEMKYKEGLMLKKATMLSTVPATEKSSCAEC